METTPCTTRRKRHSSSRSSSISVASSKVTKGQDLSSANSDDSGLVNKRLNSTTEKKGNSSATSSTNQPKPMKLNMTRFDM